MSNDNYDRTDIHLKLKCRDCGELLELDSSKSKFEFNSAYNAESVMVIIPCRSCKANSDEPLRLMRKALGLLESK